MEWVVNFERWLDMYDFAILTARDPSLLRQYLRALGFGISKVYGPFAEYLGNKFGIEDPTFAVNLQDDPNFFKKIRALGEKFDQNYVLESPQGVHSAYVHKIKGNSKFEGDKDEPIDNFEEKIEPTYRIIVGGSIFAWINSKDGFAIRYRKTKRIIEETKKCRVAREGDKCALSYDLALELATWLGLAYLNESVNGLIQGWQVSDPFERRTLDRMRASFGLATGLPTL